MTSQTYDMHSNPTTKSNQIDTNFPANTETREIAIANPNLNKIEEEESSFWCLGKRP